MNEYKESGFWRFIDLADRGISKAESALSYLGKKENRQKLIRSARTLTELLPDLIAVFPHFIKGWVELYDPKRKWR